YILLSLINKRCRIRIPKGQVPRLFHLATVKKRGHNDINQVLSGHVVPAYFAGVQTDRSTISCPRSGDGHVKQSGWTEQQRLRKSARLLILWIVCRTCSNLFEIDLA